MFNIMVKVPYAFGSYSSVSYLLEIGAGVMIKTSRNTRSTLPTR